jgi:hypothetical protein
MHPRWLRCSFFRRSSSDEIVATAAYSKVRRFQVSTDEKIAKPPGQ